MPQLPHLHPAADQRQHGIHSGNRQYVEALDPGHELVNNFIMPASK